MNDRLLSFLGLCKRAGRMVSGAETVTKAVGRGQVLLILTAEDLSDNSAKAVIKAAGTYGVRLQRLPYSKEELSCALGKHCGIVGVADRGFADKILDMLLTTKEE